MKQKRATLFGLPNSSEAYELRDFLKRSGFPFEWIDLKTDDDAKRLAGVSGLNDPRLPVCVMEKGKLVETGSTDDVFESPQQEYTQALLNAIPGAKLMLPPEVA